MRKAIGFVAAWMAIAPGLTEAHDPPAGRVCARLEATIVHGESFETLLGEGLLFRLRASAERNPPGWTIEIGPAPSVADEGRWIDYLWVVTPPYRFSNPRYLDTSYGVPAEQAVEWTPRRFRFVLDGEQYDAARRLVRELISSRPIGAPPQTDENRDRLRAELERRIAEAPSGSVHVLDAEVADGVIRRLRFRAALDMAEGFPVAAGWATLPARCPEDRE